MKSRGIRKVWIGVVLGIFTSSAWVGANNEPGGTPNATPIASQPTSLGGYQVSQEKNGLPSRLSAKVLEAAPGANVLLSMGNNEPTIAMDPNNPQHIAVATYLGIRVSTDGGLTFQPRVNIAPPAGYSTTQGGDSSLGYDSQGRLFWTFLLLNTSVGGFDVFVAQCNPTTGAVLAGYPVNVTSAAGVINDNGVTHSHDKDWLAVDSFAASPFRDRLYVVWTDFQPGGSTILTSFSTDQGATWSAATTLSVSAEGFVWPSQNTVAPNGDVYAAYHSQTGYTGTCGSGGTGCNPDGTSGRIYVLRSTNGGTSYPQKKTAFAAGAADITFNVQSGPRTIPNAIFWLQGSVQPRILADPLTAGRIYVIANDQPNSTDFADVDIVISTDNGNNWSAPAHVDSGAAGTFQVMPSAAIDPITGCIVVTYYDNRNNAKNAAGNFLLDVFATRSSDGGVTFSPDFQINTSSFDPDLNASCRYGPSSGCGTVDTNTTLRIGEYNGVAIGGGPAFTVWTGNDGSGNQDTVIDSFAGCCTLTCPSDVSQPNDPSVCGAIVNYPTPTTSGSCGTVTSTPASGSFFPVGTTIVTVTTADGPSCSFNVTVNDTELPVVTCSGDIVTTTDPGKCTAAVSFTSVVTDNCPGATVVCTPPSGTDFPIGTTTVTCIATDAAGNTDSCSFEVTVATCSTNPPVVVTQNVTVDFNTSPPTYTGDPTLQPYVFADASGPTPDTWKVIINTDRRELIVSGGVTITTVPVPARGNNRRAPGIEIHACELEVQVGAAIAAGSVNRQAGDISLDVLGDVVVNGTVYNSVSGTLGRPGAIRISSLCQNIAAGPTSKIVTYGQDDGGSDINLATCGVGDVSINGLVDASYKAKSASTIRISAFGGSVFIDGRTDLGQEVVAGTRRTVSSGVSVRSRRDPLPGTIQLQALDNIEVIGSRLLSKNYPNYGAVAIKTSSNSSKGGLIDARAINGDIIAIDRAFDDENRFNQGAVINLQAGNDINLTVSSSINDGAKDNAKAVVSTQGGDTGRGGTNMLRAFNDIITIGLRAQVLANFAGRPGANGANLLTGCNGVFNSGTVAPPATINGACGGAPDPLFLDCSDLGF
jgi:hypothetical protein